MEWVLRWVCAGLLFWVAYWNRPKMSKPVTAVRFYCVTHNCLVYEGRPLNAEEIQAVRNAHVIMHRPTTPNDIFPNQEKPNA